MQPIQPTPQGVSAVYGAHPLWIANAHSPLRAGKTHKTPALDASELIVRLILLLIATCTLASLATGAVVLRHDRRTDALHLFVLFLDLIGIGLGIGVKPGLPILQGVHDFFLLLFVHLLAQSLVLARAFRRGAHGVNV